MAIRLTIDGLNIFTFSDIRFKDGPKKGDPLHQVYLIKPHAAIAIKGWHRTYESSESFVVTEYAKTAAASLDSKANLGTITAAFAAAWPEGQPPPADEPPKKKSTTNGDGTGFGPAASKHTLGDIRRHAMGSDRVTIGGPVWAAPAAFYWRCCIPTPLPPPNLSGPHLLRCKSQVLQALYLTG